jgi:hypothetical protein
MSLDPLGGISPSRPSRVSPRRSSGRCPSTGFDALGFLLSAGLLLVGGQHRVNLGQEPNEIEKGCEDCHPPNSLTREAAQEQKQEGSRGNRAERSHQEERPGWKPPMRYPSLDEPKNGRCHRHDEEQVAPLGWQTQSRSSSPYGPPRLRGPRSSTPRTCSATLIRRRVEGPPLIQDADEVLHAGSLPAIHAKRTRDEPTKSILPSKLRFRKATERKLPHNRFVAHDAEGVDIRVRSRLLCAVLLRRHVDRRPHHIAMPRQFAQSSTAQASETKVHDTRQTMLVDEDVLGFEITVNHSLGVRSLQRRCHAGEDAEVLPWRDVRVPTTGHAACRRGNARGR